MKNQSQEIPANILGSTHSEEIESYNFLKQYILDQGFSEEEAKIMIEKGLKAVAKHLESDK